MTQSAGRLRNRTAVVASRPDDAPKTDMSNTPTDPEYVLRGVAGMVFGRNYHLLSPTTLGRAPECDICIDSRGISRRHARLRPLDYGVEIEDLKSTNGTYLNGQRVTVAVARAGDEIAFDELRFLVGAVARSATQAMDGGQKKQTPRPRRRWPWVVAGMAVIAAVLAAFATGWFA